MRNKVPKGWKDREIGNFATRLKCKNVSGEDLEPLSITKDFGVVPQRYKYKKRIATEPQKYYIAKDGDFAFDPMSLYYGAIGRVENVGRGLVSPDYVVFSVDTTVDHDYLLHRLRDPAMHTAYKNLSETSNSFGKRRRLYWKVLSELTLSLPPLPEQRKIAAILSSVDEVIQATQAVIEQTRRAKEGILQELLTKGIGRDGRAHTRFKQTPIGEIPEDWNFQRLGACGVWLSGGTPNRKKLDFWNGDIPWISAKSMQDFRITSSSESVTHLGANNGTKLVPPGTILFVVRGMSLAKEFRVGVTEREVTFNQDLKAIIVDQSSLSPFFLGHFLASSKNKILKMVTNASHGTCKLDTGRIESILVPIPPLAEQKEIGDIITAFDVTVNRNTEKVEQLQKTKKGLLQDLLTGKVRVSV